jgi:hypothetical protein
MKADYCQGCDKVVGVAGMRWHGGLYRCQVCLGQASRVPGPGWVYKTGVSRWRGRVWAAFLPPAGSDETPILLDLNDEETVQRTLASDDGYELWGGQITAWLVAEREEKKVQTWNGQRVIARS